MMTKCIMSTENGKHPLTSERISSCAACSSDIFDRYYLLVAGKSWHLNCLQCCICGIKLESEFSCFLRNNLVFCRDDYNRQFPRHCYRCNKLINPNEMVMRVKQYVFHMSCFFCVICSSRLQPGDYFGVSGDGSLFCRSHCIIPHHQTPRRTENGDKVGGGAGVVNIEQQLQMPTPVVAAPVQEHGQSTADPVAASAYGGNVTLLNIEDNVCRMGFGQGDQDDSALSFNSGHFTTDQHALMGDCIEPLELGHQSVFAEANASTPCPSSVSPAPSSTLHNMSPGSLDGGGHSTALDGGVGHRRSSSTSEMLSMMSMMNSAAAANNGAAGMSRSKRMRTSFKHNQLRIMKHYFTLNANPDAKVLKELAQKTGLTKRVLQVWFQNARAKNRRSQQIRQDLMSNVGSVPNSNHSEMSPPSAMNGANERRTPAGGGAKTTFRKDDPSLRCRAAGRFDDDDALFPNDDGCGSVASAARVEPQPYIFQDDKNVARFLATGYGAAAHNDQLENGCGRFPSSGGGGVVVGDDSADTTLSRALKNERRLNNDENASSTNYATLAACLQHLKRSDSPPFAANDDALLVIKSGQQSDLTKSSDKEFYDYDRNGDF